MGWHRPPYNSPLLLLFQLFTLSFVLLEFLFEKGDLYQRRLRLESKAGESGIGVGERVNTYTTVY